jgi:hypothetical protein
MWLNKWIEPKPGQSLVEMAIIAPILIFIMIGVFEVGWALRGYLILTNVNREITRFAVRPGYLNFSTQTEIISSYQRIRDWVDTANSGELNIDFNEISGNSTLIISHLVVDTGNPYDPSVTSPASWNCDALETAGVNPFPDDDIIIHPGIANYAFQTKTYPVITNTRALTASPVRSTLMDYADLVSRTLIPQNNKFNCEIIKKGGVASSNNLIINEVFFDQPQLLGFPLISNPFTDPVPMYAQTTMRLSTAARSGGTASGSIVANINSIGPICVVSPMILRRSQLEPGGIRVAQGTTLDILNGHDASNLGWLTWNQTNDIPYLQKAIKYPQLSLNDYSEPGSSPADKVINRGDLVKSWNGPALGSAITQTTELVQGLASNSIIVAVYDDTAGGFNSGTATYQIYDLIEVSINTSPNSVDLTNSLISASYQGPANEACQ